MIIQVQKSLVVQLVCMCRVESGERSKLDSKSRKCIFLGFEKGVKGYRLWDPISRKTITNRDVIFDEAFLVKQNEAETYDDSSQEKFIVEVEFNENSSPNDKGDDNDIDLQQQQEEPYSRCEFTKYHRDMALKT